MLDNIKERPILFSAPMVRAVLAGTKTQTRRVVKHVEFTDAGAGKVHFVFKGRGKHGYHAAHNCDIAELGDNFMGIGELCPYGQPGDRLWVRETWCANPFFEGNHELAPEHLYRADSPAVKAKIWRPSIFMPRAACRILLEIVSVRVERLADISEEDAVAEGIKVFTPAYKGQPTYKDYSDEEFWTDSAVDSFGTLWESINGFGSFAANPWVWVVEFKVIEPAAACPAGCVNALDCGNDGACQCAAAKGKETINV